MVQVASGLIGSSMQLEKEEMIGSDRSPAMTDSDVMLPLQYVLLLNALRKRAERERLDSIANNV